MGGHLKLYGGVILNSEGTFLNLFSVRLEKICLMMMLDVLLQH